MGGFIFCCRSNNLHAVTPLFCYWIKLAAIIRLSSVAGIQSTGTRVGQLPRLLPTLFGAKTVLRKKYTFLPALTHSLPVGD